MIADVAVSVVPKEQSGMASGINDTFRQVGIAIGIAAWGAIFLGHAAPTRSSELLAGTPAATGDRPRQLVESVSSGNLDAALANVPAGSRGAVGNAAREGFLSGLNEILMLGGIFAWPGRVAASGSCASATSSAASRSRTSSPYLGEAVPEPVSA